MRTAHLFAGAGGGLLADLILGHQPVVAIEFDRYACSVLRDRAADGWFPGLHVHEGDVRLFDPSPWAGRVDCLHAGFPCQDISQAGRGAGIRHGARSGLWSEVVRVAGALRPQWMLLENSPRITGRGLDVVLGDVASLGYDARWMVLGAADVGAPHQRDRWWCLCRNVADASGRRRSGSREGQVEQSGRAEAIGASQVWPSPDTAGERRREAGQLRCEQSQERTGGMGEAVADADLIARGQGRQDHAEEGPRGRDAHRSGFSPHMADTIGEGLPNGSTGGLSEADPQEGGGMVAEPERPGDSWWATEPDVGRMAHGVAARAHRIKCLGNGQVPLAAAVAWRLLGGPTIERHTNTVTA